MEGCRKLKRRTERTMSYRNIGRNNMRTGGKLAAEVRRLSELCVCVCARVRVLQDHLQSKPRRVLNKQPARHRHTQTHTHTQPNTTHTLWQREFSSVCVTKTHFGLIQQTC